jgi:hypothetical protein
MLVRLDTYRMEHQYKDYFNNSSNQLDQSQIHNIIRNKKADRNFTAAYIKLLSENITRKEQSK